MKLSDVQVRLCAPFPSHLVAWKPQAIARDKQRALMVAYIDARAVMDRLDAVCPNDWAFEVEPIPGTPTPSAKGRLTVCGVTREDIGEAGEGEAGTLKAAASDALKRCAVHFGIARYLYDLPLAWADWDDKKRAPVRAPELPEWARPEPERTPGGTHLLQALDQLRLDVPADRGVQREVYKHLRAALAALTPPEQAAPRAAREPEGGRAGDAN